MTKTTQEANHLKNSDALMGSHEEALTICHNILEGKEASAALSADIARLSDSLFDAVKRLCKAEDITVEQAFNNIAYMMGYDYKGDEGGNPEAGGTYTKREGGAWPKGTLSTYRAQMNKFDKEHGGIAKAPTFTEMKKTVNPKKEDALLSAIKAMRKEWADKPETLAKMEKVLLQDIKAGIEFEAKRIKEIAVAAKKAEKKQEPIAPAKAAPKSNAKKKARANTFDKATMASAVA